LSQLSLPLSFIVPLITELPQLSNRRLHTDVSPTACSASTPTAHWSNLTQHAAIEPSGGGVRHRQTQTLLPLPCNRWK